MTSGSLYINRDPGFDWLGALEYGRVSDGQPPSCWRPIDEHFAYFYPPRARRPRGFFIRGFDDFDPFAPECEAIWDRPRFSVPLLGLPAATAGEIVVAARAHLGDEPSVNRAYFNAAMHTSGEEALTLWRCCLESGDSMAHFAIGYTLYELGALPRVLRASAPLRRDRPSRKLDLVLARQGGGRDRRDRGGRARLLAGDRTDQARG